MHYCYWPCYSTFEQNWKATLCFVHICWVGTPNKVMSRSFYHSATSAGCIIWFINRIKNPNYALYVYVELEPLNFKSWVNFSTTALLSWPRYLTCKWNWKAKLGTVPICWIWTLEHMVMRWIFHHCATVAGHIIWLTKRIEKPTSALYVYVELGLNL